MSPLDSDASQEPPSRSAEAITSVSPEPILALGNAGCSVQFYRSPAGNGFAFWCEVAMARVVSEDFDLEWENTVGPRVGSFAELAPDIAGWLILSPLRVHTDYRAAAWAIICDAVERLPAERREWLASRLDLWRFACRPDSEGAI